MPSMARAGSGLGNNSGSNTRCDRRGGGQPAPLMQAERALPIRNRSQASLHQTRPSRLAQHRLPRVAHNTKQVRVWSEVRTVLKRDGEPWFRAGVFIELGEVSSSEVPNNAGVSDISRHAKSQDSQSAEPPINLSLAL